jgi:hypothetical protein
MGADTTIGNIKLKDYHNIGTLTAFLLLEMVAKN